ncbi:protein CBFA2T1 [Halyomorpha halys]|uniref:protein CBFA2T1 n=1 Tax=Halyomorpha halys TaxID=286706 RepID=UPI0006D4C836|nr:uncharacterized protein LOC106692705 [Halyomorpha halys]
MEGKIKEEPGTPPRSASPNRKSICQSPETSHTLSKVRRLLHTLIQHGEELGCSVGDKVKNTVLDLVVGTITVEEFQTALLEITSCPLRPFVVPYLQAYLPLLQKDIKDKTGLIKQGVLEYLTTCDATNLERGTSAFVSEVFAKKRIHESLYEDEAVPIKRPLLVPVHPMSMPPETAYGTEEQWRNIHVMLNCILSMVEKTKQALALLQHGPMVAREDERLAHTVRVTEERITQIRKKAEDAITEIKKKAQHELEKATAGLKIPRNRSYSDLF